MRRGLGFGLGLILLFSGVGSRAAAEDQNYKERTVRVQGEGKVTAVPDQAQLEFEVRAEAVKLDEASVQAKSRMAEVLKSVKSFNIASKDIQTVRYDVQPKYKYDKDGGEAKQVGFIVSNRLRVVLKNVDQAGKALEAVTKAGVSQIEGPSFGFSDPSQMEIDALKAAVDNARLKAEALAQSAGASLGKVLSINQLGSGMPQPRPMMAMAMMKSQGDVPIEKGEDKVTAQVEVVYSLK